MMATGAVTMLSAPSEIGSGLVLVLWVVAVVIGFPPSELGPEVLVMTVVGFGVEQGAVWVRSGVRVL